MSYVSSHAGSVIYPGHHGSSGSSVIYPSSSYSSSSYGHPHQMHYAPAPGSYYGHGHHSHAPVQHNFYGAPSMVLPHAQPYVTPAPSYARSSYSVPYGYDSHYPAAYGSSQPTVIVASRSSSRHHHHRRSSSSSSSRSHRRYYY